MNIEHLTRADDADWLRLRQALWPEGDAAEHRLGFAETERVVYFNKRLKPAGTA
jgi:hypothetical protein